jgi:hypothetical protein
VIGYGQQKYVLKGDEAQALVPDVTYKSLRFSADVQASLGKVFVEGKLGARLVTDTGELERKDPVAPGSSMTQALWFEHVGARALEAGLTLGYQVTPTIAVIAGGEFLRYGLDFNPLPPTAQKVAGGAIDQYLGGTLGARFTLPGTAAVAASTE